MAEPIVATKQVIEAVFDGAAARYDRAGPNLFRQFGARLVEWMQLPAGARVLDVATGAGAALIPAAQRVGANGRVVGIDLSTRMLEEAARACRATGAANLELHKMDAEHLEFPDASFDAVVCAFALFFFPAMDAALREMRRVGKLGASIGLTMWGKAPFDPAWKMFAEQVRAYGAEVRMPNKVAYAPEDIHALLGAAGLIDIETREETNDLVYASEEDWWQFQLTNGTRAAIERMDDATRARFKEEYLARLRPLFRAEGLHLRAPVIYARGKISAAA
ncbi:MAG: methyltransferase domain-containing protein [Chloroflexota bacterium]|nr:methyltransferase domain-containing protein [Chloroflexota bacterium]